MTSDVEYLLLNDEGPYHEVYVRRRLHPKRGTCRFYTIVISIITLSLLLLLFSLLYVFVLLPAWQGSVLAWDGRQEQESRTHVLTHTDCGLVEGVVENGTFVFKGIPYSVPPMGPRRWQRPQAMSPKDGTCWRGIYQAKEFGSSCVQPMGITNFTTIVGSENCLFLNVWTQSLDPLASQPVMFWIHGGDLVFGSGHMEPMRPTPSVTKSTAAVYVSINYRLGPLGFLTLEALSQNSSTRTSGNYGFMDVILALQWVSNNIRNFGGNPNKITVFGQNAGGTVVLGLLASPLASGLFQRAWLASASPFTNKTASQAARDNLIFLENTGCSEAACLRKVGVVELMQATPWDVFPSWNRHDWGSVPSKGRVHGALAVVDGYVLKEEPLHAWRNGRGSDVPTIFSTTAQEVDLLPFDPTISTWTWQHYTATVREQLSPVSTHAAQMALQLYPPGPPLTPEYQYTSMTSDIRLTCPNNVLADAMSQRGVSPVYRAVVTAAPSSPINLLNISAAHYAFQGWDLLAFFGDFTAFGYRPSVKDLQFQKVLRQQVMAFARDGRPEAPVWDTVRMCTALLSDHVFPTEGYNKARCDLWQKLGLLFSPF